MECDGSFKIWRVTPDEKNREKLPKFSSEPTDFYSVMKPLSNEMVKILREWQNAQDILKAITIDSEEAVELKVMTENSEANLKELVAEMYYVLSEMDYQTTSYMPLAENEFEQLPENLPNVSGVFFDNGFVVKTPRLLSVNPSSWKRRNKHNLFHMTRAFQAETMALLEKNKKRIPEFHSKKCISIVSVYSERKNEIPDNDNLDFKCIVDAIGAYTGGDDALSCAFYLDSLVDKNLESGTYFFVYPSGFLENNLTLFKKILDESFQIKFKNEGKIVKKSQMKK